MAKDGLKWLDSDMHLREPDNLWDAYIDPKYKEWIPGAGRVSAQSSNIPETKEINPHDKVIDTIRDKRFADFEPYLNSDGSYVDPPGQLRAFETEGIDVAVLFPTRGNQGWQDMKVPADANMALARAYNDWLYDFCQEDPTRMKHNALVPILDVPAAVKEVQRAVTKLGSVSISPGSSRGDIRLDNPIYEPIWTACERLDVTVAFHGARQVHMKERYKDSMLFAHASGRGIEHPVAFMELLFSGVLERHPQLRFAFLEAGCSWVVYWMFRLEEEWVRFRDTLPDLAKSVTMPPVEYWRRQCYTAVEVDEWTLKAVIDSVGDDNLVISSDFPHFDSPFPDARERFMKIPNISRESQAKILWDNCVNLYNLN